jgi:hypothetical protein
VLPYVLAIAELVTVQSPTLGGGPEHVAAALGEVIATTAVCLSTSRSAANDDDRRVVELGDETESAAERLDVGAQRPDLRR